MMGTSFRTRLMAAVLMLGLIASSPPATANVDINIDIGTLLGIGGRVNCTQGRRIVERKGFVRKAARLLGRDLRLYRKEARIHLLDRGAAPRWARHRRRNKPHQTFAIAPKRILYPEPPNLLLI